MRCFDQEHPWPSKVNYVDANNRVVGFDMDGRCCELYGHAVFPRTPTSAEMLAEDTVAAYDLSSYSFVDEPPTLVLCTHEAFSKDCGGAMAFRILDSCGTNPLWVVIWNFHNGCYSHGFTYWGGGDSL